MKRKTEDLPSHVDEAKRAFLKKLAIISAYSTPAMAYLALSDKRSSAWAQEVPEPPVVVSAAFMAGGSEPGDPYGTVRITFSKPMAISLNTCKMVNGEDCDPVIIVSKLDLLESVPQADVDLSDGWTWPDSMTEEKQFFTPLKSITLQLNASNLACPEGEQYQSVDGNLLVPFEATLNTLEQCDDCGPPIITSKIDYIP